MKRNTRPGVAAIFSIIMLTIAAAALSAQRVEIRLQGRYYSEPATVRIMIAVEPDATNRVLRVEADGEQLFSSSELSMTDDISQRFYSVEFKNLPAGTYTLRAEVLSSTKMVAQTEQELVVATAR